MSAFISWYLVVTILGWLTFPLTHRLFPNFADRGYIFARTIGLLIWGYVFWLFASLGISHNDIGGILLALSVLAALSAWAFWDDRQRTMDRGSSSIISWIQTNRRLILAAEILFLAAFAFLAFVRSANPEILGTEKPMELAFINAILRSPIFPPRDPWLSGYAISYYYFGYVLAAMLAKVTAIPGTIAFNLMLSLVFALGALGAFGILYNLLPPDNRRISSSFLAPLFLLIVSNLEGFIHTVYTRGWMLNAAFWKWLDIKDLTEAPAPPYHWPDTFWWWWRASRIVLDYDLRGNWLGDVIDEFPFFSFLLGDLHPHVLAIPFGLLAIAVGLNIYLGASRGTFDLFGAKIHVSPLDFTFAALVLGGLAFLNTWDILVGAALIVFSYILFRLRADGWRWDRLEDSLAFGLPLAILAVFLYLPFYLGFSSQAGGLLPNLVNPTRGAHLWVMFAPLFVPILVYLFWRGDKPRMKWTLALAAAALLLLALWGFSWLLAYAVKIKDPLFAAQYLQSQGVQTLGELFRAALGRRLSYIGGLLTLLAVLIPALGILLTTDHGRRTMEETPDIGGQSSAVFAALLIALGALLVIGPDFLYLRDQFGYRINTVFKFYYQAWMLWSMAAAFAAAMLLQNLRGLADIAFRAALGLLLFTSLFYPVFGLMNKTNNFKPYGGFTLDDFDRVLRDTPDEAGAIRFLQAAPDGVIAEAVGGSYTGFARISTYTGLQTVLGWIGHEGQWRGGYDEQGTRQQDIELLYSTANWETAQSVIQKYNIRYIYIGSLERTTYAVQEEKFRRHLSLVFQQGNVTIYETP